MTQSKFELLFTADTKQAKAATSDLRNDVAALGNQASSSSADLDKQTAALNREAEAARKAAENANRLAEAENAQLPHGPTPPSAMKRGNRPKRALASSHVSNPVRQLPHCRATVAACTECSQQVGRRYASALCAAL